MQEGDDDEEKEVVGEKGRHGQVVIAGLSILIPIPIRVQMV